MAIEQLWLAYEVNSAKESGFALGKVTADKDSVILQNAMEEIRYACKKMECDGGDYEVKLSLLGKADKVLPGSISDVAQFVKEESYHIWEDGKVVTIESEGEKGLLYGTFAFLRMLQTGTQIDGINVKKSPVMPLRMLNHWDNMDGSIERGYSGNSFLFVDNEIVIDERTKVYARLLASAGINGIVINNVNVKDCATYLITDRYFDKVRALTELFAGYGVKIFLSLNYAALVEMGEYESSDPLDPNVKKWWDAKMKDIYKNVPLLGGFLVKADSEGRPGPFTYGRTHADGANMLAEAIRPYGGLIIWRCFVYNCNQDWRDYKTDRARSGYDNFCYLDGQFADNVVLQVKNGPMDFQIREPIHPLFGAMPSTNQMLEVQIAQEYTGQQKHVCFLIPMFKEILNFRTYCKDTGDTVCDIVQGRTYGWNNCGMCAVTNTGNDENWTGHDLAAANLYGFGRLAFDPDLSSEEIAKDWVVQTFGKNEQVIRVLTNILLTSWLTEEKYCAPLGVGWMVNPAYHYGPNVDGYEYDRWGTYHRANCKGIGNDRTENGTGYALLYNEPNASRYNSVSECPDELLLFFHHVPYTHVLHSGKTVIQHIYDTHFEGANEVEKMVKDFRTLSELIPSKQYDRMLERFLIHQESACEWRDRINTYFYRMSGIEDALKREICP